VLCQKTNNSWLEQKYLSDFFSELHQYQTGQCYLTYILLRLTGRFGSSFYTRLQGKSIILIIYILRSWRRLDNVDDVMNNRPEDQLLDQHDDSDLKREEQPNRTKHLKYITDNIRQKSDDFITKQPLYNETSIL